MALVRFDQDPDAAPGTGLFHNDAGQQWYLSDPETAQSLTAPQPTASWAGDIEQIRKETPGQLPDQAGPPAPPPSAVDASGPVAQGAQQPPPGQPAPLADEAGADRQAIADYVFAPKRTAASPGGFVPKGQTVTTEVSGLPYTEEDAMARADVNLNVRQAHQAATQGAAAREMAMAEGARAALPRLQAEADEAQAERDQIHAAYLSERADLQSLIDQTAEKKIDPTRWHKNVGVLGQIGAVIAQALGAYGAILGHGPNFAQQLIDRAIDNDIAAQRAEYEQSEGKVRNAWAMLRERYGDDKQAEQALKIAQHAVADQQRAAYAAATKSQEILEAAGEWDAQNQQKRLEHEDALRAAAMGKRTMTGTAAYRAPTAGGTVAPTDVEVGRRLDNAEKYKKLFAEKGEKAGKAGPLVIQNLDGSKTIARSEPIAREIQKMYGLWKVADRATGELEALGDEGLKSIPKEKANKIALNLEAAINSANTMFGQGTVKGDDIDRFRAALKAGYVEPGIAKAAASELRAIVTQAYQAHVDAQSGPEVVESYTTAGPEISFTGKASKTPTSGAPAGGPKEVHP